jgi:type III secretion system FlhB-like substrate exporter
MKKDDWKKMLDNWRNSQKKQSLQQQKNKIIMVKASKEQITSLIESAEEYHFLTTQDKEELDVINDLMHLATEDEIVNSLASSLIQLFFFIRKMELQEEYELCARILKVVNYEIEEHHRLLKTYHNTSFEDEFLEEAVIQAREQVKLNYEIWCKLS